MATSSIKAYAFTFIVSVVLLVFLLLGRYPSLTVLAGSATALSSISTAVILKITVAALMGFVRRNFVWERSYGYVVYVGRTAISYAPVVFYNLWFMYFISICIILFTILGMKMDYKSSSAAADPSNSGCGVSRRLLVVLSAVAAVLLILSAHGLLPVRFFIVFGDSMYPTLREFDVVIVVSKDIYHGINTGDIVVARFGNIYIVHRVVYIVKNGSNIYLIVTKGDNNRFPDPPIKYSNVIGVVVGKIPREMIALILAAIASCILYRRAPSARRYRGVIYISAGIIIAAIGMSPATLTLYNSPNFYTPPEASVQPPRSALDALVIPINVSGRLLGAACSVNSVATRAEVINGSSIVLRLPENLYERLSMGKSISVRCSAVFSYWGKRYEYVFSYSLPIPRAVEISIRRINNTIVVFLNNSPYSLPVNTTIEVLGCGEKIVVDKVLFVGSEYRIATRCDNVLVRVCAFVSGEKIYFVKYFG